MRNIILLISGLLFFNFAFSQPKTKEYFLERSKKQKATAWILLGTGAAAIITGLLIEAPQRGTGNAQSFTGGLIEVGGIICTLTSIPFFIGSAKNKNRARTIAFNYRKILLHQNISFAPRIHPAFSLYITLNP